MIGGGPAGMMAAGRAAELGASVLLLEKNRALGRKLLISGGGRCNFTNAEADPRALSEHYGEARQALLSPFNKFPSSEALAWFAGRGMPYKIENNQRAFPADDQSRSVLNILERYLSLGKVTVRFGTEVTGLEADDKLVTRVKTRLESFAAGRYVLATGGTSRPETGSTGDGFGWLRDLGLRVRFPPNPALFLSL